MQAMSVQFLFLRKTNKMKIHKFTPENHDKTSALLRQAFPGSSFEVQLVENFHKNGNNITGAGVASCIYMYGITRASGYTETKRMTLLK